jgi:hypothetical protein
VPSAYTAFGGSLSNIVAGEAVPPAGFAKLGLSGNYAYNMGVYLVHLGLLWAVFLIFRMLHLKHK